MNKRIIILTAIMLVISNMAGCGREGYIAGTNEASVNKEQIEELQKEFDDLKKENEQLKEKTAALGDDNNIETNDSEIKDEQTDDSSSEMSTNDSDDPSTWSDDMVIDFNDANVERSVRLQYDIPEGDITYGMIKKETKLIIPCDERGITFYPRDNVNPKRIDSLKYFTGVDDLCICVENVDDISAIEKMPSLKSLFINGVNSSHLEDIKECKLDSLDISSCQIDNIDALKNMKSLKEFTYQENIHKEDELIKTPDFSALEELPELKEVYITSNHVNLEFLSGLPNIRSFWFTTRKGEEVDYSQLAGLTNLETLYISTNHVEGDFLSSLHNLKRIYIDTEDEEMNLFKYLEENPDDISLSVTWRGADGKKRGYHNEKYRIEWQKAIKELKNR